MKCKIALSIDTDKAYFITKNDFLSNFNQNDYFCRESIIIKQQYLSSWFYTEKEQKWFYVPTVNFIGEETQFINGRHRTAVLFNEINVIPMAFAQGEAQDYAKHLKLKTIQSEEEIELPDLKIIEYSE